MGSLPPRRTAGFVTTCCFDNWLEGIPLILEKLLMRREAVVSRQASGGPRCFKLLYDDWSWQALYKRYILWPLCGKTRVKGDAYKFGNGEPSCHPGEGPAMIEIWWAG